jgi:predicted PurR-regulated permease PerM
VIDVSSAHRKRLMLVALALIVVFWVLWSARQSLVPFMIGGLLAYLMTPLVGAFQSVFPKRGWLNSVGQTVAILLAYSILAGVLVVAGFYLIPPLIRETVDFVEQFPKYWTSIQRESNVLIMYYESEVPDRFKDQIEANLGALASQVASALRAALMVTIGAVGSIIGFAAGFALLPLWTFYVLKDRNEGAERFYSYWPVAWRDDMRNIVAIVDRVLSAYIRGQLMVSLAVGIATGLAMWAIGVGPPLVLGLLAGVTNLIPILGPIIAFAIIALVALATDPERIWFVLLAFVAIQQLESTFLVPRIHGQAVRVHPAVVMVLVVIGGAMWGLWGMIVILPVAATLRDVFVYIYNRLGEDDSFEFLPRTDESTAQERATDLQPWIPPATSQESAPGGSTVPGHATYHDAP